MGQRSKVDRLKVLVKIFFTMTLGMLFMGIILVVLGYGYVQSITPTPGALIAFTECLFYYHMIHFVSAFIILGYYAFGFKKRFGRVKMKRILISILLTPVSFVVVYIAVFLMAMSSCVAE